MMSCRPRDLGPSLPVLYYMTLVLCSAIIPASSRSLSTTDGGAPRTDRKLLGFQPEEFNPAECEQRVRALVAGTGRWCRLPGKGLTRSNLLCLLQDCSTLENLSASWPPRLLMARPLLVQ